MARTELRGNGVKHEALVKGIVLTVSAGIFFAGLGCFAWAADFAKEAQGESSDLAPHASSVSKMEELAGSSGQLDGSALDSNSGASDSAASSEDDASNDSSASAGDGSSAGADGDEADASGGAASSDSDSAASSNNDGAAGSEERSDESDGAEAKGSSKSSSTSKSNSKKKKTAKTHVVHHTAYVRVPVYKTVTHPARVERTVTTGGKTIKVWQACPVCGKRHTSSLSEQVLDHYDETFCAACGAKHSQAYDETVAD